MVADLADEHGPATALRALADLPGVELLIAGGPAWTRLARDPGYRELTRLAGQLGVADRATFAGQVSQADMPALMRSADLLLNLSPDEALATITVDAMACGLPVIAAAAGAHRDAVIDRTTGLLVPPWAAYPAGPPDRPAAGQPDAGRHGDRGGEPRPRPLLVGAHRPANPGCLREVGAGARPGGPGTPGPTVARGKCFHIDFSDVEMPAAAQPDPGRQPDPAEQVEALQALTRVLTAVALRSLDVLDGAVSLAQFRMLTVLADLGRVRSARVARALGLDASTVTRLADRLVSAGHVARGTDPRHRSVVTLELTPSGQQLVSKVAARRRRELSRIMDTLPPASRTQVTSVLRQLVDAAGDGYGLAVPPVPL
jgi:DNA-binding MarR family transcriptional regulator